MFDCYPSCILGNMEWDAQWRYRSGLFCFIVQRLRGHLCSLALRLTCTTVAILISPAFQFVRLLFDIITRFFRVLPPRHDGCLCSSLPVSVNCSRRVSCPRKPNSNSAFCVRASSEAIWCTAHQCVNELWIEARTPSSTIALRAFSS